MLLGKVLLVFLAVMLPLQLGFAQSTNPRWTATFDRVGPLKLGTSLAAVNGILGTRLAAPAIPGQDPTNRCFDAQTPRFPAVQLMIIDNRLARIDVVNGAVMVLMAIDHVSVPSGVPAGGLTHGILGRRPQIARQCRLSPLHRISHRR